MIHSTAVIEPGVELGADVKVGAFAVIEGPCRIGDGCRIDAHAVIHAQVRMGRNNRVHPHAVLGGLPQDLGFDPGTDSSLDIGDNNTFREGVTISRGTRSGKSTIIGSSNYLMNGSHVGHDCSLGNNNILASNVALGGHVEVGNQVFFGGGAVVHQFCRIGSLAMLQGLAGINKDALPYTMIGGRPGKHYRLNLIGLRRSGFDADRIRVLSSAFRRLRNREDLEGLEETPELVYLKEWLTAESKRHGILGFIRAGDRSSD